MRLRFEFIKLYETLVTLGQVFSDSSIDISYKNIVICIDKEKQVNFMSLTPLMGYKTKVACTLFEEDIEPIDMFSIALKDIFLFLSTYKALRYTKVGYVDIEYKGSHAVCTVEEVSKSDEESKNYSSLILNLVTIANSIKSFITMPADFEYEEINGLKLKEICKDLDKILQPTVQSFNVIQFSKGYASVRSNAFIMFKNNEIEYLEGISLSSKLSKFIAKYLKEETIIKIYKNDNFLYLKPSTDTLIYAQYNSRIQDFSLMINTYNDNKICSFSINRYKLAEMLKRFSLYKDVITLDINPKNNKVMLKTNNVAQELAIISCSNLEDIDNIQFSMLPSVLMQTCLSVGKVDEVVFTLCKTIKQTMVLGISDTDNNWFAYVNAKIIKNPA